MQLADILLADDYRDTVVERISAVIEEQVANRKGFAGAGLRTAIKMAKATRGDTVVSEAVNRLLPDYCEALEPHFQQFRDSDETDFPAFVKAREDVIAEDMVAVIDRRAEKSNHQTFRKMHKQLRSTVGGEVRVALPHLAQLVQARL